MNDLNCYNYVSMQGIIDVNDKRNIFEKAYAKKIFQNFFI